MSRKKPVKQKKPKEREETEHMNRNDAVILVAKTDKTFMYIGKSSSTKQTQTGAWTGKCIHCSSWLRVEEDGNTNATLEHIVPTCAGGSQTDPYNLALACKKCNVDKGIRHDPYYPKDPRAVEVINALLEKRRERMRNT